MKRNLLFLTFLAFCLPNLLKAQYEGKLGINMGSVQADGYVDMIKAALPWDHGSTDNPLSGTDLDENLWPKTDFRMILMDNRPVAEWSNVIDDPDKYRIDYSGTYKSSFSGKATISNIGGPWSIQNQAYDQATNTTTFDLVISKPGENHGLVIMNFESTQRTADSPKNSGITNLRIIRPGYENKKDQFFADHHCIQFASHGAGHPAGAAQLGFDRDLDLYDHLCHEPGPAGSKQYRRDPLPAG